MRRHLSPALRQVAQEDEQWDHPDGGRGECVGVFVHVSCTYIVVGPVGVCISSMVVLFCYGFVHGVAVVDND